MSVSAHVYPVHEGWSSLTRSSGRGRLSGWLRCRLGLLHHHDKRLHARRASGENGRRRLARRGEKNERLRAWGSGKWQTERERTGRRRKIAKAVEELTLPSSTLYSLRGLPSARTLPLWITCAHYVSIHINYSVGATPAMTVSSIPCRAAHFGAPIQHHETRAMRALEAERKSVKVPC